MLAPWGIRSCINDRNQENSHTCEDELAARDPVYCCIHWPSGMRRFSGETGAGESINVPDYNLCVINTLR